MQMKLLVAALLLGALGCRGAATDDVADAETRADGGDTGAAQTTTDAAADVDEGLFDVAVDAPHDADMGAAGPWRSALYPEDWVAPTDGNGPFLHDFSYAGYRHGEELVAPTGAVFAVEDFGADPTGAADSHAAFQAAVDAASVSGGVVTIGEGLFRINDIVSITASHVVLRGEGSAASRLWFTRSAGMSSRSHLEFRGAVTPLTEAPLAADAPNVARFVEVADASAFAPGDDVSVGWVVSDEFIAEHAMQGVWVAFNGTWQPFFRRQVIAVDTTAAPHRIELDVPLRYPARVRDGASLRREAGYLREVGVVDVGVADAVGWDQAWAERQVHVIGLDGVADGWIAGVESFASPGAPPSGAGAGAHLQNGGVLVLGSKRVTVTDSRLEHAQNRGGGGCGYLFEVRQSSEVLFRDLVGRAGRHNFIQNWGFGASGIVWLRVHSVEGRTFASQGATISAIGDSEFHHSLAMANLIDSSTFDDGFAALNRKEESTGAGHTATQSVFWNVGGAGRLRSYQFGHGYIIGTAPGLTVLTGMPAVDPDRQDELEELGPWTATWPEDLREGIGRAAELVPSSLYEDQLRRRRGQ